MTTTPDIRVFRDADEAGIVDLWNLVFSNETPWNAPEAVIAQKRTVQPDLFFVAVQGDRIIGTLVAGFDGVRGWIHRLAVHPEFRRSGLATQLMHRAELGLKAIGCPKLNLQVRVSNLEVLKFYEALGYAVEERASLGKPLV